MKPVAVLLALLALLAVPTRAAEEAAAPPPLAHEAILDAPVADVWDVFTTSEGWKLLGVAKADVDFRVGGVIRTHYDPNGTLGDPLTIENTILSYEPNRMISFRATKTPANFPFPKEVVDRTWSVVTLDDLGDGRTRLTIRGHGYGTDEASLKMRAMFEQGNAWTLQELAGHFAKAAPSPLRPIEVSEVVAAAPADVFRSLSTSEGVKAFLGVTNRIELTVGGPYELYFLADAPEGQRGSEGCEVLSWLPGRMLSFTWNAPPEFEHARPRRTVVVIELETESPGATRVRLTHHGFAAGATADPDHAGEWEEVRAYFAKAWPQFLAALRD